jgi:hypothetical protein
MSARVPEDPTALAGDAQLEWYSSVISRQIDGIPVAESVAWARLTSGGRSISESVYWPDIPESVIAEAKQLKVDLDGGKLAFVPSLSGQSSAPTVAIHHTNGHLAPFIARTVVDVDHGTQAVHVSHFAKDGSLVWFPGEVATQ